MRTTTRVVVTIVLAMISLMAMQIAASAATAIEYGLIAALISVA